VRTRIAPLAAAVLVAGAGCAALRGPSATPARPPLGNEGELRVYVSPLPRDAERIAFTVESVTLSRREGGEVSLGLAQRDVTGAAPQHQRLLASARVPAGDYTGVSIKFSAASIARDGAPVRLLTDAEPVRSELAVHLGPGEAAVVWLQLNPSAVRSEFSFSPRFTATLPARTAPQAALYCTDSGEATLSVVDRIPRVVTGIIPVPGTPRGIAVDAVAARAYVALERENQLQVLDLAAGAAIARIPLMPGDGPTDVALGLNRRLVVVNERSRTVAIVDPDAMVELGRVPVGDAPGALLLDRSGRRAFVVNRASATITVIDVANRAVFGTIPTEPEPLRVALSRDGTRLYVVQRGSSYIQSFGVPSLTPLARVYIGLGATSARVDSRTDLIYVSRGDERAIAVLDPVSLQQIDRFEVPGAVTYMAIDDATDALLALVPERRSVVVVDLTSRRVLAEIAVGADPYTLAFSGERL
jgi:YVTN family beta-propeller protein